MAVRQWTTLGGTVINEAGNEEYVTHGGWAFTEDPGFTALYDSALILRSW
ncbi:MAG: hypothetical protein IIC51_05100 [Planctomycetes bacterium]|nr:hypothetical protein [Planctomycetota bacterium]